jgi:catalase
MSYMPTNPNPDACCEPNPFGGPKESPRRREPTPRISGEAGRYNHRHGDDDHKRPDDLCRLTPANAREGLMDNVAAAMQGAPAEIVRRQVRHFHRMGTVCGPGVGRRMGVAASPGSQSRRMTIPAAATICREALARLFSAPRRGPAP